MATRGVTGAALLCTLLLAVTPAWAEDLASLLPNLFGKGGILLAPPPPGPFQSHSPHFTVASEAELTVLNDSLRGQLSSIPLPSPASGLTFTFDPALGALVRSTDNFGPIYSQRADTTGRGKLTFGFSYSRFTFDQLDGKQLDNGELQVTFLHEQSGTNAFFETDTIQAKIYADITSDVFVLSATYGVLENLDVSIALPIVHTDIRLKGVATIIKTGSTGPGAPPGGVNIHRFSNGSDTMTVHSSGDDTGVGDLVLRAKWNFLKSDPILLAAGLDLRLPTGSVDNLRGVGTPIVSPVFIASTRPMLGWSPHANIGFHLSGDTSKAEHEFYWNIGFDWSIIRPVTFVFDILGRRIIDNNRIEAGQEPGGTRLGGSTIVDASVGVKVNVWRNVLGVVNVLLPLNSTGLRDKATPLIGLEATF